ncbi:hypothetical protein IQ215_11055 [Cyanobacterium stanieri LEGE 03274]|uniref:Uncharacterized protein n=1 Tax=Cyanobacterium stanieri LEGE 03274 TaxID=1828756 RepID=A0ABR9V8Q9_9CHRO|nr:hypothetical protein [Cyanobacterium stanieri]MBE9223234.1 hypothetical protein [Cyanobacterium stanieri LEGE 03274]
MQIIRNINHNRSNIIAIDDLMLHFKVRGDRPVSRDQICQQQLNLP